MEAETKRDIIKAMSLSAGAHALFLGALATGGGDKHSALVALLLVTPAVWAGVAHYINREG